LNEASHIPVRKKSREGSGKSHEEQQGKNLLKKKLKSKGAYLEGGAHICVQEFKKGGIL